MTHTIALDDLILRIGLSLLAGLVLGLEREEHGRAAGLKTTMLACVSAALAMILSEYLFLGAADVVGPGSWRPDPARLAQGILTGMGFLGAGAIIRQGNSVRGVTTAAVLWFVTILGIIFGSGHILLGLCGWLIALGVLWILPALENNISKDWYGTVVLSARLDGPSNETIRGCMEKEGASVLYLGLDYDLQHNSKTVSCEFKLKKGNLNLLSQRILDALLQLPGVTRVKWE